MVSFMQITIMANFNSFILTEGNKFRKNFFYVKSSFSFFRSDPFFSRGHGSLFDDLDSLHSHTTTFSNGNGNTIHITRTVLIQILFSIFKKHKPL